MPALIVRPWLHGLLAGLLALAAIAAPAQHERMMLGRAVAEPATAHGHGTHAGHGAPAGGHHEHLATPACFACVLMAAPGLPTAPFAGLVRFAAPEAARPEAHVPAAVPGTARSARHARAPPAIRA